MIRPLNSPTQIGPLNMLSEKRCRNCSSADPGKRETESKVFIVKQKYFLLESQIIPDWSSAKDDKIGL
jgi:hypothetical protein